MDITEAATEPGEDSGSARIFKAKWSSQGSVGHWGHIHTRKNLYQARIIIEPANGAWKITGLELLDEQRVDPYAKAKSTGS